MRKLKKINIEDNLAQMFLICQGFYAISTGVLLFNAVGSHGQNSIYKLLSNMMSLDAWGVVLILSGVMLTVSAFQTGRLKCLSMLIGGLLGGVLLIMYGVASFEINFSYAVGIRYIIMAFFMLAVSYLGSRTLWIGRRSHKNGI